MSAAPLLLRYTTTCKLCHQRIAESPALNIPLVGNPGVKVQALMKVLMKHLEKQHPEEFANGAALLAEFPAFLILCAFEYEEPTMPPRLESIRAGIFSIVRKNTLTDASIEHITAGFGLDPEDARKVNQAMKAVRDLCCELGPFAPQMPEASKLVLK
jgi:hypothetical protein